MVLNNCGLPEPPDSSDDNFTPANEIIMGTDTDTDEDDAYDGYQPLPMSAEENLTSESDDDDDTEEENHTAIEESLPAINREDVSLLKEVWSAPNPKAVDIEMDSNKMNEVKQAMLNVTLPSSSIPDWAHSIPEEEWKQELTKRLQCLQGK